MLDGNRVRELLPEECDSDEQLVSLVQHALQNCGYAQLHHLQVYCENGRVTLQGRLPTIFLKEVAFMEAKAVKGVREVDNDINVNTESSHRK
ncbi:MAG TPA: BON domain-containing protein [Schlesneria sp.]|jgi:osmotically-inducible protein OsmY